MQGGVVDEPESHLRNFDSVAAERDCALEDVADPVRLSASDGRELARNTAGSGAEMLRDGGEEHAVLVAGLAVGARQYLLACPDAASQAHEERIDAFVRSMLAHVLQKLHHGPLALAASRGVISDAAIHQGG